MQEGCYDDVIRCLHIIHGARGVGAGVYAWTGPVSLHVQLQGVLAWGLEVLSTVIFTVTVLAISCT
jgi:hypothetical protein